MLKLSHKIGGQKLPDGGYFLICLKCLRALQIKPDETVSANNLIEWMLDKCKG